MTELLDPLAGSFGEAADAALLAGFVAESAEYMESAEAALLELESNPEDDEAINTVLRAFHTIKGTSAFLGLEPVTRLAHHAESLFSRFREGELRCTGALADLSLRSVDLLAALLRDAERCAGSGDPLRLPDGYDDLILHLDSAEPEPAPAPVVAGEPPPAAPPLRLGDILVAEGKADRRMIEAVAARGEGPLGIALVREGVASLTDVAQALRKQQGVDRPALADATVGVRTAALDDLTTRIGELLAAQAAIGRAAGPELAERVASSDRIAREIREIGITLRTVSLRGTFQRMARIARDAAARNGKLVELVVEGQEESLDRRVVEAIGDPLVHMVRNAVAHGIEAPELREVAGKPRVGRIRLIARHAAEGVVIELHDDGKGLDHERIARTALEKGLIASAEELGPEQLLDLIFLPGFSTAGEVTELCGRGIGMDVVRRGVEAVGGRVAIASEPGVGSIFTIHVPTPDDARPV